MFKMAIVSHLGEVVKDTRTVGDRIRYRIICTPSRLVSRLNRELEITDRLDEHLVRVKVFNDGMYDPSTHTAKWRVRFGPALRKVVLELEAEIDAVHPIRNVASYRPVGRRAVKTNTVETTVVGPPRLGWIPLTKDGQPGRPQRVYMKDETTTGLTVNFDIEGVFAQATRVDGVAYHRLSIPGQATTLALGRPELPIVGGLVEVPHGVTLTPQIVKSASITLPGYNVYPAQEPVDREGRRRKRTFALDRALYQVDAVYPGDLAAVEAEDVGVIRGHRVVFLKVRPFQFNPVTRELVAYSNVEVRLEYDRPGQIERIDRRLDSPEFEALLQDAVLNYKRPERFDRGDPEQEQQEQNGCHYLILTDGSLYNAADANNPVVRLRNWKQRKGLITRVVDVANIPGGNTPAAIQAYLQTAYDTWNPAPAYVLLVGDADLIPTDSGLLHASHTDNLGNATPIPTDLTYALLDGADYFPDLYLGRLSVENTVDAATVVDKILAYEQNPPATPAAAAYYANTSLVCLFEDVEPDPPGAAAGNGTEDPTFRIIEFSEPIRTYLNGARYTAQRIYSRSGNWAPGPQLYEDGTNVPVELTLAGDPANGIPGFPWTGARADIQAAINAGNFVVTFNGHGSRDGWGRPDFHSADLPGLTNGDLTPVIFSFTCRSGWFDNETDHADLNTAANDECLCEQLLRHANGGAVAVVGSTRNSRDNNDFMMLGTYKGIWPDFAPNPNATRPVPQLNAIPLARMGQIHTYSKVFMANAYAHDWARQASFELYHLFGDPEMPVWTHAPGQLQVSHPQGAGATGEQDLVVKVTDQAGGAPVQSATVTLTRSQTVGGGPVDRILQVRQTDPAGIARFTIDALGEGDVTLTVTALNYRPYEGQLTVVRGGAWITLNPPDGVEGQDVPITGDGFDGDENVDIYVDGHLALATAASGGRFGYGPGTVTVPIPSPHAHERINVVARGQTSHRYAVDVFQVRDANPVDLWTYSQWDSDTWGGAAGPVWNSPDIQLYDSAGAAVDSANLTLARDYTVRVTIHNNTAFPANGAQVVFRWADYGVGGPWDEFHTDTRNVPPGGTTAEAIFTPAVTGHVCLRAEVYHAEDITPDGNQGQENLHVGPTSSPTRVCFRVWNTTKEPAAVFLEVRQLRRRKEQEPARLWGTWVLHPDPQVLQPGDDAEACVVVDPDLADATSGESAEFAVTGFIDGALIGGVNLLMTKS